MFPMLTFIKYSTLFYPHIQADYVWDRQVDSEVDLKQDKLLGSKDCDQLHDVQVQVSQQQCASGGSTGAENSYYTNENKFG